MQQKKTERANLEKRSFSFLEIGLIISLALVLLGFEWKTYDREVETDFVSGPVQEIPEEMVQITQQKAPPPPPAPQAPSVVLNIVENTAVITADIRIDAEADESLVMDEYIAPPPAPVTKIEEEEEVFERQIFLVVEEDPEFVGGDVARMKFLSENIVYPQMARESGIQGTVYLTFVIERDGSVTDIQVLRGIGGGCDEEAIRVVKNMPKWKPGKQRGKPVRVQFRLPIKFVLTG
ncbi:MAG: energy transducer TonB [Lentimicrobiaceae bacterium]|nr:energy transducer TonB [Lentimicrobiaceae bacterium]